MVDSPSHSQQRPSTTTTLTVEALPAEIIVRIVTNNLTFYDIFALQTVCRRFRAILLNDYWPQVRTLAISTVEETGNPLSASLIISDNYGGTETVEITQSHLRTILGYCAKSLGRLSLSHHGGWTWTLGLAKTKYWNFPYSQEWRDNCGETGYAPEASKILPFNVAFNGKDICDALTFCPPFSSLHWLDLSHIPLVDAAKSLLTIANAAGGTLRILRLQECLKSVFNAPGIVYSPIEPDEFAAFLTACPHLVELDISGNELPHTLPFGAISPKLRAFKAHCATLHINQFLEVMNAAPGIEQLQISLDLHTNPNQPDLDKFMLALPNLCKLQQLWLVYIISPGTPLLTVRFPPRSISALKALRIGQCNNNDVSFVKSALTEGLASNRLQQLRELYVCQGENMSPQDWHRFSANAQNLTKISLFFCLTIDDTALAKIARNCRQMQEIRITVCQAVTWEGLGFFLDYSKKIHIFEAAEQMTEELLEKVMETMDNFDCCSSNNNDGRNGTTNSSSSRRHQPNCPRPFFYFIRFQLGKYWHDMVNPICRQSESHNLHPSVIYSRENRDSDEAFFAYDPYHFWC